MLAIAAVLATCVSAIAETLHLPIRPGTSEVSFDATSRFKDVHALFQRFDGELAVDPDDLGTTHVHLVVDAASVDSGSSVVDRRLRGGAFFDVARFPTIVFDTVEVQRAAGTPPPTSGGTVAVVGRFTLHGVTRHVSFPAQVDVDGAGVTVRGAFTIRRGEYGIDARSLVNPVGDTVRIAFALAPARGPSGRASAMRAVPPERSGNCSGDSRLTGAARSGRLCSRGSPAGGPEHARVARYVLSRSSLEPRLTRSPASGPGMPCSVIWTEDRPPSTSVTTTSTSMSWPSFSISPSHSRSFLASNRGSITCPSRRSCQRDAGRSPTKPQPKNLSGDLGIWSIIGASCGPA